MDGGSTDNFLENVKPYSDLIQYQKSSPDRGQADVIKQGVRRLKGNIIGWLNADDYYFPGALDIVSNYFENHADIDVVYGDAVHVTPEGFFLSYFPAIQEFNAADLTRTCFICQPACFMRRDIYEKVGGINPTLQYTMDWDLWCRLSASGAKFSYLHEVLAAVRYYPGTKTLSGGFKRYMEIWRIEKKYGRRLWPRSWLGTYLFNLSFHGKKSATDKYIFTILDLLRRTKKYLRGRQNTNSYKTKLIYGFRPWDSVVDGRAVIHLPWYGNQPWVRLRLKVTPQTNRYRVKINDNTCKNVRIKNGYLVTDLPEIKSPHREISLECLVAEKWHMHKFQFQLSKLNGPARGD
jgi:glycosyltransferase involved in cell wall biosynthesis